MSPSTSEASRQGRPASSLDPDVVGGVLVRRRRAGDGVVVLDDVVERHRPGVRQDVVTGLAGEAVRLAVGVERRRVDERQFDRPKFFIARAMVPTLPGVSASTTATDIVAGR